MKEIDFVSDIPSEYELVTDSQDIKAIGESTWHDYSDYGCLFVLIENGEYASIYGCESNVPRLKNPAWKLL